MPYVEELAPVGCFHLEGDRFRRRYRHRLHRIGVRRIEERFRQIAAEHPGKSLVLLCFEHDPADCHRSNFARWWLERPARRCSRSACPSARSRSPTRATSKPPSPDPGVALRRPGLVTGASASIR